MDSMIINISKVKTEALLLLCKDLFSSYIDKDDLNIFEVYYDVKNYINDTSKELLKQLNNVTRDNSFYIENRSSFRVSAILKAYNYLNKQLSNEFKEGTSFNPSMLCFSLLAMWFKELNKEAQSKEYIYFLLYPYSNIYDKLLLKIKDEKFKALNIKMIDIAEQVMIKYDRVKL